MYMHVYTYICMCIHVYLCVFMYYAGVFVCDVYICMCVHLKVSVVHSVEWGAQIRGGCALWLYAHVCVWYLFVLVHVCGVMNVCIHVYTCVCVHMHVCTCACMCVCICIVCMFMLHLATKVYGQKTKSI